MLSSGGVRSPADKPVVPTSGATSQYFSSSGDTSEDDGLVAVLDDAVLAVPPHVTRQGGAFDVGPQAHQVFDGVAVIHPDDVLLDDRPLVELCGHVMGGRADELDAAFFGPSVGCGADERRQKGVVDVDHRAADLIEEPRS